MALKININKAAILKEVELGVKEALIKTGIVLVAKIRTSMSPGTGKTYKWKGGVHTASAPGQPPSPFSRRLHDSITYHTTFGDKSEVGSQAHQADAVGKPKRSMGGYSVVVGSNVEYARSLEMGDKSQGLAPRPFLWPALKMSREDIKDAFTRV